MSVIANGVRLNGVGGFVELRHRRMYSLDAAAEGELSLSGIDTSGCSCPTPVPTCRATSCEFHRPAIS